MALNKYGHRIRKRRGWCGYCGRSMVLDNGKWRHVVRGLGHAATLNDWGQPEAPKVEWDEAIISS